MKQREYSLSLTKFCKWLPENCPELPLLPNGNRAGDPPHYHGESLTFYCDTGYDLMGPPTITCMDGKWSDDQPICLGNEFKSEVLTSN